MRVTSVPIEDPRWSEFSTSHPNATPFHLPAWAGLIADCYRFEAFALAAEDSDGEILGGVPVVAVRSPLGRRRWVSLPFTDYCPLLTGPGVELAELVSALGEYVTASRTTELEIRAGLPEAPKVHPVDAGYRHALELPSDPADLHPNKGHRNSRNRAIRQGIAIEHSTSAEAMDVFYRLHTLTRRRHGVPVQPRRFFTLLHERLVEPGFGFVSTASLDGDIVAAGVYLGHNGTLIAKYFGSDPDRPNTGAGYLIDWEAMVAGCQEGYSELDLGRSDPGADGLRLYKSSWGAVETPLLYTHLSEKPPSEGGVALGELPKKIIRRSPVWVCRGLGEVLYRYSA